MIRRGLKLSSSKRRFGDFRLVRVVLSHSRLMRMMRQKMRYGQSRDDIRDDANTVSWEGRPRPKNRFELKAEK
jgi:hypothetical protein